MGDHDIISVILMCGIETCVQPIFSLLPYLRSLAATCAGNGSYVSAVGVVNQSCARADDDSLAI